VFEQHSGQEMIIVYRPKLDAAGNVLTDSSGGVVFERVGGVKSGSTGVIKDASLRGQRGQFIEYKDVPPALGIDLIHLYPIQLDHYQGIGWFLGDCLKIV
jgi:hypothetical protein